MWQVFDKNVLATGIIAFCVLLMFLLCSPSFENLRTDSNRTWEVVLKQIDNHSIQYAVENPDSFWGFWLVVLLAMFLLYYHRCYVLLTLLVVVGILSMLVAHFVIDITRSMIYAMPLVFINLKIISWQSASLFLGGLMILIVVIILLVPTYRAFGNSTIVTHFSFLYKLFGKFYYSNSINSCIYGTAHRNYVFKGLKDFYDIKTSIYSLSSDCMNMIW